MNMSGPCVCVCVCVGVGVGVWSMEWHPLNMLT